MDSIHSQYLINIVYNVKIKIPKSLRLEFYMKIDQKSPYSILGCMQNDVISLKKKIFSLKIHLNESGHHSKRRQNNKIGQCALKSDKWIRIM